MDPMLRAQEVRFRSAPETPHYAVAGASRTAAKGEVVAVVCATGFGQRPPRTP